MVKSDPVKDTMEPKHQIPLTVPWASRRAATRPQPLWYGSRLTAAARSCPTWCARSLICTRSMALVVPEIAARAHIDLLDAETVQALTEAGLYVDAAHGVAAAAVG